MKTGSTKQNLAWSLALAGANYLFPLVVYMHVSRVLGATGVGLVGFIDSVTTYFILFSMMGISALGIRTVASARDDCRRLASDFYSLLSLHALFTTGVLIVMALATIFVPDLRANADLMGIGMCKVAFNVLLVEWFFIGMEEFRFITLRTVAVRSLYVLAVFLLVRSHDDVAVYYLLTMLVVVAVAFIGMSRVISALPLRDIKIRLRKFAAPFFSLGVFELTVSTSVTFCMVYLGFACGDEETGFFSTASKVVYILTALYYAYNVVMTPRSVRYFSEGNLGSARRQLLSGTAIVGVISIVAAAGIFIFAPETVWLISGSGFEGAVLPLRILAFALPVIGISKVTAAQALVPAGADRRLAINSTAGFLTCAVTCIILIPRCQVIGAAIAWTVGETVGCILNLISAHTLLKQPSAAC